MDNLKKNFFLIIKPNHFAFHVVSEDYKILLNEEIFYNVQNLENNANVIKKFLDENIFKIEKKFNIYIEEIYLIIDDKNFINVDISLIKDSKFLSTKIENISNDLSNIKESILKSNIDFELVHMIINKFIIDKKDYLVLPEQINQKKIFLEIRLICLKTKALINFKKILSRYQISIKKIFNYEYVDSFKLDRTDNISLVAIRLINGLNQNEINLQKQNLKNRGFFEKFFQFFS